MQITESKVKVLPRSSTPFLYEHFFKSQKAITVLPTRQGIFSSPTMLLIIANVIVFVFLLALGQIAYDYLAQRAFLVLQQGFYWQLFTALFVHFDVTHIGFNMVALFYFGTLNESRFSSRQYLLIYLGAGLVGNFASLFLIPPDVQTGGASGAILGLLGSYVAIAREARQMGPALLYAFLVFVLSARFGVNIYAHLFGLLVGLALGIVFTLGRRRS